MRFAVIANIQGNAEALRAVLADIEATHSRVDRVISAGDLVGLGAQPNEVLDLVRQREIESVRGNYDDAIALERTESGVDLIDEAAEVADSQALAWTRGVLSEQNMKFLRDLPRDLRLSPSAAGIRVGRDEGDDRESEYKRTFFLRALFGGMVRTPVSVGKRVVVLHGSPRALNEFVREDTAGSILGAVARDMQADVLVSGHAGTAFRREAHDVVFIGAGSVSGPYAKPGIAQYVVVNTAEKVEVEVGTVGYDVTPYQAALRDSGLPPALRAAALS